ncbi:MAG: hypothetical protein GAK43_02690 [Stenotrophomonas maltophilia]|nr:MAG: hypothetical protein GAK43_02690 [Stenotrophomonas maltophilia]
MIDTELMYRLLDGARLANGGPYSVERIARRYHQELPAEQAPEPDILIANALILVDLLKQLGFVENSHHHETGTAEDAKRLTVDGQHLLGLLHDPAFVAALQALPLRADRDSVLATIAQFSAKG